MRRAPYPRIKPSNRGRITMEKIEPPPAAKTSVDSPVLSNPEQQEKLQPLENLQQVEEEIAIVAMSDPQLQPQKDLPQRNSRARQGALASLGAMPALSGSNALPGPIGSPIKGFVPIAAPVQPLASSTVTVSSRVAEVSRAANTYAAFQAG